MKKLIILFFLFGYAMFAQAPGSLDASFSGITSGFDAQVNSTAVQSDGKILVCGWFTSYNGVDCPDRLIRLTPTGALDPSFTGVTTGFNGYLNWVVVQSDGKILVGGWFTTYNGVACPIGLVRLTSTGAIDPTFTGATSGFDNAVTSIVVQSDGKILVGGWFTSFNGTNCPDGLVRLTSTGAIDPTFTGATSGINGNINSIAVQSDGKILVGGWFTTYNGVDCSVGLVRLTSTGAIDPSFAGATSGFDNGVTSIVVQSDGKILAGGTFMTYNGADCPDRLVRLTTTGELDPSFSGATTGFNDWVTSIAVQSGGKILVGGSFSTYNFVDCPDYLVRLTPTGELDPSFTGLTTGFNSFVKSITLQNDGKILACGDFNAYNGANCPYRLARINNMISPSLGSTYISTITGTGAFCGSNISSDGNSAITARGICWNTSGSPTNDLPTKIDETGPFGTGDFSFEISGLQPNTTYHVRAYATNSEGTSYGQEITFTTIPTVGEWGLITFAGLIAIIGGAVVWRRFV